jgi:hypothetical protein
MKPDYGAVITHSRRVITLTYVTSVRRDAYTGRGRRASYTDFHEYQIMFRAGQSALCMSVVYNLKVGYISSHLLSLYFSTVLAGRQTEERAGVLRNTEKWRGFTQSTTRQNQRLMDPQGTRLLQNGFWPT